MDRSLLRSSHRFLICFTAAACGGLTTASPQEGTASQPIRVFTHVQSQIGGICVDAKAGEKTPASELRAKSGERNVVVSLAVADEKCTGLGGVFLLARDVDSAEVYWMGGHGCFPSDEALKTPGSLGYAAARIRITEALLTIGREQCVAFPGEPDRAFFTSDTLEAAATFSSLAAARSYAASLK
jgi:hypothetical protein